jgi:uncharacterized membrane protein YidH (DUF202 family)
MVTPVYEPGAPAQQRGPRPATVATAGVLQIAAVVLLLAGVVLSWFARAQYDRWADEAASMVRAAPGELNAEYGSNLVMAVAVSVLAGLPTLWLAATLWPMLRGSKIARIFAAVAAFGVPGLGLLMVIGSCATGFLFLGLFAAAPIEEPDPDAYHFPEDATFSTPFQDKLWELQGSRVAIADTLPLIVLAVMALLTVVAILLIVPATNRWYSPERAARRGHPYPVYYPVYVPMAPYGTPQPGMSPMPPPPVAPLPPAAPPTAGSVVDKPDL